MLIIKTNLIPKRFDALALRWFILIRPEHAENEDLLAHEELHILQQRRDPLYFWKWLTNKRFRARIEAEAYRVQGLSHASIEHLLHERYDLTISEAREFTKYI